MITNIADISKIRIEVNRFVNKYNKIEKIPFTTKAGDVLYPSEINLLESIGDGTGSTVTALTGVFGITKGGVSHIVSKLERRGYVRKERSKVYAKEIELSLTDKGRVVYNEHAEFHNQMEKSLFLTLKNIPSDKVTGFLEILAVAEQHLDAYFSFEKEGK